LTFKPIDPNLFVNILYPPLNELFVNFCVICKIQNSTTNIIVMEGPTQILVGPH